MKIDVASPCKRDWSKMTGDEKVRFCGDCKLNVYNLSAMSEAEAEALVREREGRVCVKFFARPDGTVITRDCPVGVSRKRKTYAASMAAVASLMAAAPFMGEGESCGGEPSLRQTVRSLIVDLKVKLGLMPKPPMVHVMGEMVAVPPPAANAPPALDTRIE